jgi:hypothetical protein
MLSDCECGGDPCRLPHAGGCRRSAVAQLFLTAKRREVRMCLGCGFGLVLMGLAVLTPWRAK